MTLIVTSCKKPKEELPTTDIYATNKTQVKTTYADMAFAVYSDAYESALELKNVVDNFLDNPSSAGLDDAKQKWLAAREVYGQSEIFRFVDGPIDNTNDGPEGLINAWPMDEAYVDYVVGNATSGIINNTNTYPTIDAATIVQANELGGETNISCGYHAIEFMLWGQDMSSSTAGTRPYTDFVVGGTANNQTRRSEYLRAVTNLLVQALNQVKTDWDPSISNSYYHSFIAMDNDLALRKIFNSLRVLSGIELAGERIYVAYQNEDQEDEHSCFSDNTHRDIYLNALGIENLYKGTYISNYGNNVNGYAMEDLVGTINASQNDIMLNRFATTMNKISLMYTPFDQAIVLPNERPKVLEVVVSLQQQQSDVELTASLFGISF